MGGWVEQKVWLHRKEEVGAEELKELKEEELKEEGDGEEEYVDDCQWMTVCQKREQTKEEEEEI